jgi:hypothetical protein
MKAYLGLFLVAALLVAPSAAWAQKPVTLGGVVSKTFTIEAIDHASRVVTLKDKDGVTQAIACGPEIKRFDELKVGDKVTFQYHESLVTAISKPGAAPRAEAGATLNRSKTTPGGTISQQVTVSVTITAIDPKIPSVTVKTPGGDQLSFKADKKNIEGYKAGDQVDITYTEALAISVAPVK